MKKANILTASVAALAVLTSGLASAGHTNPVLTGTLVGAQEVGTAGDDNGLGIGYVFGIDGDPTTLCYVIIVNGIQLVPVGDGMAAHIHEGAPGENGPVVAALAGPEDGNAGDCLTEGEAGKFPTGEIGIVHRILDNPSDFYINVHNPDFPAGALRGQLSHSVPATPINGDALGKEGASKADTLAHEKQHKRLDRKFRNLKKQLRKSN